MSTDSTLKKKLQGKVFYTEYGIGDNDRLLSGWEAEPLNDNTYLIKRSNNSQVAFSLGQEVPGVGKVSLDSEGNLNVGDHVVLVGKDIIPGMTAKRKRKKGEYMLSREGERKLSISVGDNVKGHGIVGEIDEFGNLKIGDKSIPIESKRRELKLLVYQDSHEQFRSGFKCHFNMLEPGSGKNNLDGMSGVFFAAKGRAPAKFCEVDSDGKTLQTAVFWPSRNRKFLVGKIRSIEDARLEKALVERLKVLEEECKEFDIQPEEHYDWVVAKERLDQANNLDWQTYSFSIDSGHEALFGCKPRDRNQEYSRGFG